MKKFKFELVILEREDEFWEQMQTFEPAETIQAIRDELIDTLRERGFMEGYDLELRFVEVEGE